MQKLVEIASGVSDGTLKAIDVVEEYLKRISARESEIHAFNLVTAEQARHDAEKIDSDVKAGKKVGALAGVPIALKDNMCTRGVVWISCRTKRRVLSA